jgi:hypothetical protein
MPNHIMNAVEFIGEKQQVSEIIKHLSGKETDFDLNKIIKMPEELNILDTSDGSLGLFIFYGIGDYREFDRKKQWFDNLDEDRKNEIKELADKYISNLGKFGFTTWYKWSIANWGTKWNSYDSVVDGNTIVFYTAWSPPLPVIYEMSKQFKDVEIKIIYSDENVSFNTGKITFCNGEVLDCIQPEGDTKEGFDIYFELHPYEKELYKFENNNYSYVGEKI